MYHQIGMDDWIFRMVWVGVGMHRVWMGSLVAFCTLNRNDIRLRILVCRILALIWMRMCLTYGKKSILICLYNDLYICIRHDRSHNLSLLKIEYTSLSFDIVFFCLTWLLLITIINLMQFVSLYDKIYIINLY